MDEKGKLKKIDSFNNHDNTKLQLRNVGKFNINKEIASSHYCSMHLKTFSELRILFLQDEEVCFWKRNFNVF